MVDEQDLITGCCKEDRSFQRKLYELFSGKMLAIAVRYSKSRQEAEDVVQETFIKVYEKIKSFRNECPLELWIKRILINTALNHQRSKLYMYPMVDIENLKNTSETINLAESNMEDLLNVLHSLPTGCKMVFNLYAIEGYQHKEIAEMLGISEGTSKSQYARAKVLLQNMISKTGEVRYERYR